MDIKTLQAKFAALVPVLTERSRRLWAATEALALGHGGIALVERATGISRSTVVHGIREVNSGETLGPERTRRSGGGRKSALDKDGMLFADLEGLVEPTASGGPDSPLRWTSKSVRRLAAELGAMGHSVSHRLVADLLNASGYSLRPNERPARGLRIRIATLSFATSTIRSAAARTSINRPSRWIPRKRNSSGISRTLAGNGGQRETPSQYGCMTSSSPSRARPSPTAFTT